MLERLSIPPGADGDVWAFRNDGRRFVSHRHSELELNLVTRGTATYVLADRRYELGVGSAVWLFPGQEHVITRMSGDMAMWIAVFRQRLVRAQATGEAKILRRRNPRDGLCRTLRASDAARLTALCSEVLITRRRPATFNAGLSYLMLAGWDAFSSADALPDRPRIHPAVRAAAGLVANGAAEYSVEQIADEVGLSAARLSRLFRAQMGLRLADFRNRVRMTRFFELYGQGDRIKMLSAALQAGFGSYPQFHRVFTQHTGHGPRQYFGRQLLDSSLD